ncbi:hypothetical protein ORV05_02040 [Amycolatopsis cynarae]|uniref:Uncharacterized protein n=1 Tax=Amycolatopsis cynarae TaxID=2995223 RepID=A0ABY7B3W2_9PSEU|nr:hypothetical protein [Amycolatopsis sp. HUAS 11-8]WAL66620.1 hypothetical protein ORV05_02040 [Amycolatopsis sp. HUAS 11-8]
MSTELAPVATISALATAAQRLIRITPAPTPSSVTLISPTRTIDLQPGWTPDPVHRLAGLLVWTHSLTGLTGTWWHTEDGHLYISLVGRGPFGVTVNTYSSIPFRLVKRLVRLPQGERESVTPDELYRLAIALREQTTEVAA